MNKVLLIPTLILLLIVLTPTPILLASTTTSNIVRSEGRFRDLLSVFNDERNFSVITINPPGLEVEEPVETPDVHREFIVLIREEFLNELGSIVYKIKFIYRVGGNALVFVIANRDQVLELISKPWVLNIAPSRSVDELIQLNRVERSLNPPTVETTGGSERIFGSWEVMGIKQAWDTYGVSGSGVVVGVVDTGIDFGYQELGSGALARDTDGSPLTVVVNEHIALTALDVVSVGGFLQVAYRVFPVYSTFYTGYYGSLRVVNARYTVNFKAPNVVSLSGVYKFGALEWFFADYVTRRYIILRIPVVLVDANVPGVYDTVVFDLSTAFYSLCYTMYYTLRDATWRPPNPAWLDYSFADEPVFNLNNPIVARDFDGDGVYDFSLGSIAGAVIDTYGVTDYLYDPATGAFYTGSPGQRLGLPSSGKYVALLTDWNGHGTSVASIIGSRGVFKYSGYGGLTYRLYGVAYNAKIAGGTGFWAGDLIAAEYWLAGYDYDPRTNWFIPSKKRADVISNSWAYTDLAKWLHQSPGVDVLSLIFDELALFNPFGAIIVFAAGNNGPGYGSLTSPSAGLFIITVGASTNFEYYQMYGYPPGYPDDVAPFSSRGPNALGYPKPDVVAVGMFEWAGVRVIEGRGWGVTAYWEGVVGPGLTLFSGTSEATPFVSGVIALGLEALRTRGLTLPQPQMFMKILLKSTCDDIEYPVLIQGSGRVNAYKLVKTIMEFGNEFIAYIEEGLTKAVFENYFNVYGNLLYEYRFADTAHYTVLPPGSSETFKLRLEGGRGVVSADAVTYSVVRVVTLFNGVYDFTERTFILPKSTWVGSDYLEVYVLFKNVSYSLPYYGVTPVDDDYMIRVDVFDYYMGSMYRLNSDARYSTTAILTVGDLGDRVKGDIIVRLRPAYIPPKPVQVEVVAVLYRATRFSWITFSGLPRYINYYGEVPVTISIPSNARPGLYEAKIKVYTPSKTIVIPVTILVPLVLDGSRLLVSIPRFKSSFSYDSYTPLGTVDSWATGHPSRIESLDWRMIPVLIQDPSVTGLILHASWVSGASSSLEVVAVPPGGVLDWKGNINYFASYKVTARHGYVYNPSPTDQQYGRLRLYIPTRWPMLLRETRVWFHRSASPTSETVSSINYFKPMFHYGLYRVMIAYGSYSGSRLFDPVALSISIVKATQSIQPVAGGYRVTAVFQTSPVSSPFLNAPIFALSSEQLSNSNLNPLVYGYRRYSDGSVSALNVVYGVYIGSSNNPSYLTVTYTTSYGGELDTVLVLNIPWHASGIYYYSTDRVVVVETYYNGVVSAGSLD